MENFVHPRRSKKHNIALFMLVSEGTVEVEVNLEDHLLAGVMDEPYDIYRVTLNIPLRISMLMLSTYGYY